MKKIFAILMLFALAFPNLGQTRMLATGLEESHLGYPPDHFGSSPPPDNLAPGTYVPGELLIGVEPNVMLEMSLGNVMASQPAFNQMLAVQGVHEVSRLIYGNKPIYRLQLDTTADLRAAITAFAATPGVRFAEPNYIAVPAVVPDDPFYIAQQQALWQHLGAETAWDVVTGTVQTTIAVIDSGLDLDHPDLETRVWVNPGEVAENGLDDDNNGYVDDVHGWNFVNENASVQDDHGHGTQVAGIAAAGTNNGVGIAGVDWQARIMPVKVMNFFGQVTYSDMVAGILYAADKGADVINLSLGAYSPSQALEEALEMAAETAVVVAGAGNDNVSDPFYPAAYDESVIAVGGTTISDTKTTASNFGNWVDITAPAEDVYTTYWDDAYLLSSGTSMAAPFVAGTAALLMAQNPDWSPATVWMHLLNTAAPVDDLNPGYEGQLGAGRLDIGAAVTIGAVPQLAIAGTTLTDNGDGDGGADAGETISMTVQLRNEWHNAAGVMGRLVVTDTHVTIIRDTAAFGDIASLETGENLAPFVFQVAGPGALPSGHIISFTLVITDDNCYQAILPLPLPTQKTQSFSGIISADTVWTAHTEYYLTGNVLVNEGVTLTLEPGVTVRFGRLDQDNDQRGERYLRVLGTLIAQGTAADPIRFVGDSGTPLSSGDWLAIQFEPQAVSAQYDAAGNYIGGSHLRYCRFQDAVMGLDLADGRAPHLEATTFNSNHEPIPVQDVTLWLQDVTLPDLDLSGGTALTITQGTVGNLTLTGGGTRVMADDLDAGTVSLGNGTVWNQTGGATGEINASGAILSLESMTVQGHLTAGSNCDLLLQEATVWGNASTSGGTTQVFTSTLRGRLTASDGTDLAVTRSELAGLTVGNNTSATIAWTVIMNAEYDGVTLSYPASFSMTHCTVANNGGDGVYVAVADPTVVAISDSTIMQNGGDGVEIAAGGFGFEMHGTNLLRNGDFALRNDTTWGILARNNYWDAATAAEVETVIWHFNDDFDLGMVIYQPFLDAPSPTAPPYVVSVTLDPPSPVGLEDVIFVVEFSRPMTGTGQQDPAIEFHSSQAGDPWLTYDTSNSGLPDNEVWAIAVDGDGAKWFGTSGGGVARFDGLTWTVYDTSNSGLPEPYVNAIAIDGDGCKWFGTGAGGVARFDGLTWTVYDTSNSGLPNGYVHDIAIDGDGDKWFGTDGGVARFDGLIWTVYDTSNSGLPHDAVYAIAIDGDGSKWFGTGVGGVARFDGATWMVYDTSSSNLPDNYIHAIAIDGDGAKWFGTDGGVVRFDGAIWTVYDTSNSGLPDNYIHAIAIDGNGAKWFGTEGGGVTHFNGLTWLVYDTSNSGLPHNYIHAIAIDGDGAKWFGTDGGGVGTIQVFPETPVTDNPQWITPTRYQANYAFNALTPRDIYTLTVSGARDGDSMLAPTDANTAFVVDYAGGVGDDTPPPPPVVTDDGAFTNSTSQLHAAWIAYDPDTPIIDCVYAIGSAPGQIDVVNWTSTSVITEITHTGLTLQEGVTYYFTVRVRNAGRLWSEPGYSNGITVDTSYQPVDVFTIYLPLVLR